MVSTSLISITDDLDQFWQSSWVITAYLLTYTGFLKVWTKLNDAFGTKPALLAALTIFIAFSGGCGASQTMSQLIICRAFQGVGGSGLYSLSLFAFVRIAAPSKSYIVSIVAGSVVSLGLMLGSIFGGALSSVHAWRWIFLFHVPVGAIAYVLICISIPTHFPRHCEDPPAYASFREMIHDKIPSLKTLDLFGMGLLLAASFLLVAALTEADVRYGWSSGSTIVCLGLSGVAWVGLFAWQWSIGQEQDKANLESLIPWSLIQNRVRLAVVLGFFLTGSAMMITLIQIPQRLQLVNQLTPLDAGVRILAYTAVQPLGTMLTTILANNFRIPFVYILLLGASLQTIGMFLYSEITTSSHLWPGQYGYFVMTGLGMGTSIACLCMMVPQVIRTEDQRPAIGTTLQLRTLGGALGVAIANSVFRRYIMSHASQSLDLKALFDVAKDIHDRVSSTQSSTTLVFAEAYNMQMKVVGALSAAQILVALLAWRREQVLLDR
ncbi:hypothetical protein ASPZODRAFT_101838 [Penicilliopsis zonata CBS 506.65]|uniref:Major facilitator superfamily (MFS) profile domain-containing protein n=1 Tax=Penicilliopsis zonata CBS 506.65 TaxID=1073090 RepID=A0A1L9S9Z2_9EURO|nr:hypothetical protein ASPZODRAFT_101838 [Penicilliopsis zonata CBS 506.65]OJJ44002.1 hypothetical protein ASPZODRAFT_101838 [Penicilliopsis zonata CBS 506.65]